MPDFKKYTQVEGVPPDGTYLCAMDEFDEDEDADLVVVEHGKVWLEGRQRIVCNCYWKRIEGHL